MTHQEKVEHLIEELGQQGLGPYTVAPPLFRLLWRLSLEIPPPVFLGFRKLSLLFGAIFGVLWGVGMWLWVWRELGLVGSLAVGVPSTVLAGLLFGVIMALFFRWRAGRLELPSSWEYYPRA